MEELEILKMEAAEKKFPSNDLLQRLNVTLSDFQHCKSVSAELLSSSRGR